MDEQELRELAYLEAVKIAKLSKADRAKYAKFYNREWARLGLEDMGDDPADIEAILDRLDSLQSLSFGFVAVGLFAFFIVRIVRREA